MVYLTGYMVVVAYLKNGYWHSNEGTEENYEILDLDGLSGDRDYNLRSHG
jgi:hypothetical protein